MGPDGPNDQIPATRGANGQTGAELLAGTCKSSLLEPVWDTATGPYGVNVGTLGPDGYAARPPLPLRDFKAIAGYLSTKKFAIAPFTSQLGGPIAPRSILEDGSPSSKGSLLPCQEGTRSARKPRPCSPRKRRSHPPLGEGVESGPDSLQHPNAPTSRAIRQLGAML